jgi:hypothetical protein
MEKFGSEKEVKGIFRKKEIGIEENDGKRG